MVTKKLQTLLLLGLAATCVVVLWLRFFPNDERRIRRRLDALAEATSVPESPTLAGNLAAGNRLRDFLTSDVVVNVEVVGEGRHHLIGRQDVLQTAVAARTHLAGLRVAFLDVKVVVGPERTNATVGLTVRATQPGQRDFFVQEMKLSLRKEDREWRICRAETVQTLRL